MSLKDAVLGIAEEMDDHAAADTNPIGERHLARMWARQLRTACKAAGDTPSPGVVGLAAPLMPAAIQHQVMIEKAREEFRQQKERAGLADGITRAQTGGERLVECLEGPFDGTMNPAPEVLEEGAHTLVGGVRYTFREGKLHHNPIPK